MGKLNQGFLIYIFRKIGEHRNNLMLRDCGEFWFGGCATFYGITTFRKGRA